jgi:hypothetical protein
MGQVASKAGWTGLIIERASILTHHEICNYLEPRAVCVVLLMAVVINSSIILGEFSHNGILRQAV